MCSLIPQYFYRIKTHIHTLTTQAARILEAFIQEDPPRHMTEGVVANLTSLYELLGDK